MMNLQLIWQFSKSLRTSTDWWITKISLAQDRKVVAMSNISVFSNPLLLENLQNARRNECASSPAVSSRRTALVDEQVNKQMYALICVSEDDWTYTGPAKSIPVCEKGETRMLGMSGKFPVVKGTPSNRRQVTHFWITLFMATQTCKIEWSLL